MWTLASLHTNCIRGAPAEGVGAAEGHNFLVVEAHAVKDVADVLGALAGVRQAAVGLTDVAVGGVAAARLPWDRRACATHTSEPNNASCRC